MFNRQIDLNLLVVFDAVYSTRNITQAAKLVGMSQPTMSNALARLREQVGDPLFVRSGNGVAPTLRADRMILQVRDALSLLQTSVEGDGSFDISTCERKFRIAALDAVEPYILPHLSRLIVGKCPGVSFEIVPHYGLDAVAQLQNRQFDIALFAHPQTTAQIKCMPLFPVDIVCIVRKGNPQVKGALDLDTYQACGHVVLASPLRAATRIDSDLMEQSVQRQTVCEVSRLWSVPPLVASSDLVGLLPRWFARSVVDWFDLEIHETPYATTEQYMYMVWHERSDPDPAHGWLREQVLASFGPLIAGDRAATAS